MITVLPDASLPVPGTLAHMVLVEAVAEPGITLGAIQDDYPALQERVCTSRTSLARAARALVDAGLLRAVQPKDPHAKARGLYPTPAGIQAVQSTVRGRVTRKIG